MAIAQSKLTAQGQISVPAKVRRKLGLGPGSVLEWDIDDESDDLIVRRGTQFTSDAENNPRLTTCYVLKRKLNAEEENQTA